MQKIGNEKIETKPQFEYHCSFESGWYQANMGPERAFMLCKIGSESEIKKIHKTELDLDRLMFTFEMPVNRYVHNAIRSIFNPFSQAGQEKRLRIIDFMRRVAFSTKPGKQEMEKHHPWKSSAIGDILFLHEWDWRIFRNEKIKFELKRVEDKNEKNEEVKSQVSWKDN